MNILVNRLKPVYKGKHLKHLKILLDQIKPTSTFKVQSILSLTLNFILLETNYNVKA
jgi:hypothetical protein